MAKLWFIWTAGLKGPVPAIVNDRNGVPDVKTVGENSGGCVTKLDAYPVKLLAKHELEADADGWTKTSLAELVRRFPAPAWEPN